MTSSFADVEPFVLVVWNVPSYLFAAAVVRSIVDIWLRVSFEISLFVIHFFCSPKDYSQQLLSKRSFRPIM